MNRVIYLLAILFLIACKSPVIEKVEKTYPDNQPKLVSFYQKGDDSEVKVEEKHFYQDGTLKMNGKFLNNKREGEWKAFFNNKQLQSLGVFEDGKRTGVAKVYYPNGQLRYEGQYKEDLEIGHWKFYSEQGEIIEEKDF